MEFAERIIPCMEALPGPASLLAQISTLRFPPVTLHAGQLREVFNRLSQVGTFNYQVTGDGAELATPHQETGEALRIVIGRDSVTVAFDPTQKSAEFASGELLGVLKEIAAVLPIPVFVHQTHVLRKTFPLPAGGDARKFLMEGVAPIPPAKLAGWKRGFASVGVRFVFPPQQMTDLSAHDLRIESFLPDPGKIFVEDSASFLVPLPAGQWDQLKANLAEAHRFLDEHAGALLRPAPAPDA